MKNIIILSAIISLLAATAPAEAQVPHLLRYQGSLSDDSGTPLEGPHQVTFRLYTGAVDPMGSEIYVENINVTCTGGVFSVLIGTNGTPQLDTLAFDQEYWLGLEVQSEGEELSPRHRITSSAYALRSAVADLATVATTALQVDVAAQGSGGSLDADTVDGLHAAQLLDLTAHTGIVPAASIAQGAGSGLDSDTVDGNEATALFSRASHTGTQLPSTISPQGIGSELDADTVDGIHATSSPQANTLLTLGSSSQWPISTIPFHFDGGTVNVGASSSTIINFGQSFSTIPIVIVSFGSTNNAADQNMGAPIASNVSTTSFTLQNTDNESHAIRWFAIGN